MIARNTSTVLMSLKPLFLLALAAGLLAGCASPQGGPRISMGHDNVPPSPPRVLDNHGGYSHAGRRITLSPDGHYVETTYTDAIGQTFPKIHGRYRIDAGNVLLVLERTPGKREFLTHVDYGGQHYWVHVPERDRVSRGSESWLRQTSLRSEN